MRDPDEVIGLALSGLRELEPRRTPVELMQLDKKRLRARRRRKIVTSIFSVTALIGTLALILQPKSAIASLLDSAQQSNAQSAIHIRAITEDGQPAAHDMWIFPDHFIRQEDHFLHVGALQGASFNLDDRLPFGFKTQTEQWEKDLLQRRMTGKVDEALERARQDPRGSVEVIRGVRAHAGTFDDYRVRTPGCYQGVLTVDLYVDPSTHLMRFEDQQNVSPNAEPYRSTSAIEYPNPQEAARAAPEFPAKTRFFTEDEIRKQFLAALKTPEQSCVVGGIRITLYGVLVRPTSDQKGLTVDVITQGGPGPDILQDHWVEIEKGPLASEGRLSQPVLNSGHAHLLAPGKSWIAEGVHVCGPVTLGGQDFIVNPANETLPTFPETLTLRVPVWRSDTSVKLSSTSSTTTGQTFHPSRFVGYASFVTHRILSDAGDRDLDLLGFSPWSKTVTHSH